MPTGDAYVNLALKRFLSQNRMSANLLDYCVDMTRDGISRSFPESGLFTFPVTITHDGAGSKFDLSPDPVEGIDNQGRVLILSGAARTQGIPYENTTGDEYWIGLKYIEIPDGVYPNPRTGVAEYDKWKEEVGERDEPNSVVDNGNGTLTANVNDLFIDGASHDGRDVTIWLVNPVSIVASTAIETVTVSYSGGNNTITTGGDLGQSTISTNYADYQVACVGVSVRNAGATPAGNPFTDDYCVIGYIVGGDPGSSDTGAERDLSGGGGHTLQKAYDGLSGAGSGREITINGGSPATSEKAVELRKSSSGPRYNDIFDASLRIRTDIPTGMPGVGYEHERAIDITARYNNGNLITSRIGIADFTGGGKLLIEETVNVSGSTVTFTRGGSCDLTLSGNVGQILVNLDYIELNGSALGHDGVYIIQAVTSSTITLRETDGSVPSLAAETGLTARIYRQFINMGGDPTSALFIHGLNDFYEDQAGSPAGINGQLITMFVPSNTDDSDVVFRMYRDTDADFRILANGDVSISNDLTVEDDITVSVGSIVVTDGDITATGTSGDITGKNVSAVENVGALLDVNAGVDVNAQRHVYSDSEGNGVGDFKHGQVKTRSIVFSHTQFRPGDQNTTRVDYGANSWAMNTTNIVTMTAPIKLPDGCALSTVSVKVNTANHSTNPIDVYLFKEDKKLGVGEETTAPSRAQIGTTGTSDATGWDWITLSNLGETIDNDKYSYNLEVVMDNQSDELAGAKFTFTYDTITLN